MQQEKFQVIEKMEAKGITAAQLAEKIEFNPTILALYLNKDEYPIPGRILKLLSEALVN